MNLYLLFVFYFDCSFFERDSRYNPHSFNSNGFRSFCLKKLLLLFVIWVCVSKINTRGVVRRHILITSHECMIYIFYMHILRWLKFVQPNVWLRKAIERYSFFPFSSNRRVFKWQRRLSCGGFNEWTKYQKKELLLLRLLLLCFFLHHSVDYFFFLFRLVISCENRHGTCHYDCDNDLDLTLLLIMGVHSFNFQHNGHTRFFTSSKSAFYPHQKSW